MQNNISIVLNKFVFHIDCVWMELCRECWWCQSIDTISSQIHWKVVNLSKNRRHMLILVLCISYLFNNIDIYIFFYLIMFKNVWEVVWYVVSLHSSSTEMNTDKFLEKYTATKNWFWCHTPALIFWQISQYVILLWFNHRK